MTRALRIQTTARATRPAYYVRPDDRDQLDAETDALLDIATDPRQTARAVRYALDAAAALANTAARRNARAMGVTR